jgi:hypothetical protein
VPKTAVSSADKREHDLFESYNELRKNIFIFLFNLIFIFLDMDKLNANEDVLHLIFKYLSSTDLENTSKVCKK